MQISATKSKTQPVNTKIRGQLADHKDYVERPGTEPLDFVNFCIPCFENLKKNVSEVSNKLKMHQHQWKVSSLEERTGGVYALCVHDTRTWSPDNSEMLSFGFAGQRTKGLRYEAWLYHSERERKERRGIRNPVRTQVTNIREDQNRTWWHPETLGRTACRFYLPKNGFDLRQDFFVPHLNSIIFWRMSSWSSVVSFNTTLKIRFCKSITLIPMVTNERSLDTGNW